MIDEETEMIEEKKRTKQEQSSRDKVEEKREGWRVRKWLREREGGQERESNSRKEQGRTRCCKEKQGEKAGEKRERKSVE